MTLCSIPVIKSSRYKREANIKKLQQFWILKFQSTRLKKAKYNLDIPFSQAKINNEVITITNSELLRRLFSYKNIDFNQNKLDKLLDLRKKIQKSKNNDENALKLMKINEKLKKILFIEDFIIIEFKNKKHFEEIIKRKGFYVNGIKFTLFMSSAGMIRKNTAMFINNNIKHPLMDILENGRNEKVSLVPAKWGAYFSLYASSTIGVSFPKFAIVSDKTIEKMRNVNFIEYIDVNQDDKITTKLRKISSNSFDGQGLISPKLAKQWSEELELDYTFSCAIIRAPFLKGLAVTFDLNKFATNVAGKYEFKDVYGNKVDIREIDLIVTESMFKLKDSYKDTANYTNECKRNKLGFSIAQVNPKTEKSYTRTSYQFLQILNLNNTDIVKLCAPTIEWFRSISGNSPRDMILYSIGESSFKPTDFHKLDVTVKAILLNPNLSRDPYIQRKFIKTITKKKKQSFMGSLLVNANYQFMISDPYYQICHIFNLENEPLLQEGEHYSKYWLDKNIDNVTAIRSPIVHHSEINNLHFKSNSEIKKWYKHLQSGIVFPASGIGQDCDIHGGADFDGDIICTIKNDILKKGQIYDLPIVYNSKKARKKIVDSRNDKEQSKAQMLGYNSKVGFATNVASSLYTMLEEYKPETPEHTAILNRLRIGRAIQGEIIDSVKGLNVPPFRKHWTRYISVTAKMSASIVDIVNFNNTIICKKRPSFFRFLYPHYMTNYNKELKRYNILSILTQNKPFKDIFFSEDKTQEEDIIIKRYKFHSFFLDNKSVVNRISAYMRVSSGLVTKYSHKASKDFDYSALLSEDFVPEKEKLTKMKEHLKTYKEYKMLLRHNLETSYENLAIFAGYLRNECNKDISTNEQELANYAIYVTYGDEKRMVEFPWIVFPNGLIQNIIETASNEIKIPVKDINGDISYLWSKYKMETVKLEELYEK